METLYTEDPSQTETPATVFPSQSEQPETSPRTIADSLIRTIGVNKGWSSYTYVDNNPTLMTKRKEKWDKTFLYLASLITTQLLYKFFICLVISY